MKKRLLLLIFVTQACFYLQAQVTLPAGAVQLQIIKGLTSNRKILSCNSNGTVVDLWHVNDESGRQKWLFEPHQEAGQVYYTIWVGGGVSGERKMLSTTANGARVDLWTHDDGSGRQRWIVEPVGTNANLLIIRVAGGVTGDRKYLSCTPDGVKVDLWTKDDGSGRQQWQMKPLDAPQQTVMEQPTPTMPVNSVSDCSFTESQYNNLIKTINDTPYAESKMTTAKVALKNKCLSLTQVKGLVELFTYDESKLDFLKFAYGVTSDKTEYYTLASLLTYDQSKQDLMAFIESQN